MDYLYRRKTKQNIHQRTLYKYEEAGSVVGSSIVSNKPKHRPCADVHRHEMPWRHIRQRHILSMAGDAKINVIPLVAQEQAIHPSPV